MTQLVPSKPTSLATFTTVLALAMCGCGSAPPTDDLAEEPNAEFADQLGEALGTSEHCDTTTLVDKTFDSAFPKAGFASGSSYDNVDCRRAFVADIPFLFRSGNGGGFDIVMHNETPPTSKSECEKLRLGAYAWFASSNPPSFKGSIWRWGRWDGRCIMPSINLTTELTVVGLNNSYRIAVSARRQFTALDSTSDFNLRSIRFYRTN